MHGATGTTSPQPKRTFPCVFLPVSASGFPGKTGLAIEQLAEDEADTSQLILERREFFPKLLKLFFRIRRHR